MSLNIRNQRFCVLLVFALAFYYSVVFMCRHPKQELKGHGDLVISTKGCNIYQFADFFCLLE